MKYKAIKSLKIGDSINQVFLISAITGGTTKTGKPFGNITLKDASGTIGVKIWDFDPKDYPDLKTGTYIKLGIQIEEYKGSRQAKAQSAPMVVPTPDDTSVYESSDGLTQEECEEFYSKLIDYKNSVENIYIKTYLDVIFDNQEIKKKFITAPASVSNRGAYRGGLVEHTYKVMLNAIAIMQSQGSAKNPAPINRDIVVAGVLTHDLGKMHSYEINHAGAQHTRSGLLLAHLPMSYGISIQSFIQAESVLRKPIPEDIKDHINHCILAHHGVLEYGSPIKPQSIEAQIVHVADMSDSTSSNFAEVTRNNLGRADENGFVQGNYFSNRTVFINDKND